MIVVLKLAIVLDSIIVLDLMIVTDLDVFQLYSWNYIANSSCPDHQNMIWLKIVNYLNSEL